MWLYNTIFIMIIFFVSLNIGKIKIEKCIFYSFVIIFFILSFFRWEVGTDWDSYYWYFNLGNLKEMNVIGEILFKYLNYYVYILTHNYTVLLFIMASLIFIQYPILYKYSKNKLLTILFLYCMYLGNIFFVRQNIAVALIIVSLKYALEKKVVKFMVLVFLATLFHRSAIFCLIIYYIINYIKMNKENICIFLILMLLSFLLKEYILLILIKLLPNIYGERIALYIKLGEEVYIGNSFVTSTLKNILTFIQKLGLVSFVFIGYKRLNKDLKKISKIYIFGVFLYYLTFSIGMGLMRIVVYFEVVQVIIFPSIYTTIKNKVIKMIFLIIIVLYCYFRMRWAIYIYEDLFIPYKTFFIKS